MLKRRALDAAIPRLPSHRLHATFFRAMPLRFASDPLGKRRPIFAQRFNIAGGARVLYLAEDQVTCLHEARLFGSPLIAVAIYPVRVDLHAVIDLRDSAVQQILRTNAAELGFNFRLLEAHAAPAPTQRLGERIAISGCVDGIIYESPMRSGRRDLAVIERSLPLLGPSIIAGDAGGSRERLP